MTGISVNNNYTVLTASCGRCGGKATQRNTASGSDRLLQWLDRHLCNPAKNKE